MKEPDEEFEKCKETVKKLKCAKDFSDFMHCSSMSTYDKEGPCPAETLTGSENKMKPIATKACNKCYHWCGDQKATSRKKSTEGPCTGKGGYHYDCNKTKGSGDRFVDTVSCCLCCDDTPDGPELFTRCICHFDHVPRP